MYVRCRRYDYKDIPDTYSLRLSLAETKRDERGRPHQQIVRHVGRIQFLYGDPHPKQVLWIHSRCRSVLDELGIPQGQREKLLESFGKLVPSIEEAHAMNREMIAQQERLKRLIIEKRMKNNLQAIEGEKS